MGLGVWIGAMLFGVTAMFVHDFRTMLRIFNIPGLIAFSYFWFIRESVRWLLANGHIDRAIDTLKRIAKVNRRELSDKAIKLIEDSYSNTQLKSNGTNANENAKSHSALNSFWMTLKTRALCVRFICSCWQWMGSYFSLMGLLQSSIQIPGIDSYVSFVIVISADIFGIILMQLLSNRLKRRVLLFFASSIAGIAIVVSSFIPKNYAWIVVFCFVIGKSLLNLMIVVLSLFTAEQFPTNVRTTILNTSIMFGQIGSMAAPYVVILVSSLIYTE